MTFETPNGKTITSFRDARTTMWKIKFTSGGELPADLAGEYTHEQGADNAIRVYLNTKTKTA